MAGGAQAKMSTWFSKPNQSLISKVTKKRVGFNLKIFVFALLKTVHCRTERNPGRIGRLFNCNDRCFFIWREAPKPKCLAGLTREESFPRCFAARGFRLRPKMCRPSANTENSRRTREKPLVPRVRRASRT